MKSTDRFKTVIEDHLKFRAFTDPLFAKTLKKKGKNIDDCIKYVLNTVQESKCNGFEDDEIFNMAVHYYDEDDIELGKTSSMNVVVNHQVKLTDEEIADAKKKAIANVISEAEIKMRKKPKKATVIIKPETEDKSNPTTLF